jgi:hypothetical protein
MPEGHPRRAGDPESLCRERHAPGLRDGQLLGGLSNHAGMMPPASDIFPTPGAPGF